MKFKGNENIVYRDDNDVDYSRKTRVHRQSLIGRHYDKFAPQDLSVETDIWDGNPSVNKKSWPVDNCFDDSINDRVRKLNKGSSRKQSDIMERISGKDLIDPMD